MYFEDQVFAMNNIVKKFDTDSWRNVFHSYLKNDLTTDSTTAKC